MCLNVAESSQNGMTSAHIHVITEISSSLSRVTSPLGESVWGGWWGWYCLVFVLNLSLYLSFCLSLYLLPLHLESQLELAVEDGVGDVWLGHLEHLQMDNQHGVWWSWVWTIWHDTKYEQFDNEPNNNGEWCIVMVMVNMDLQITSFPLTVQT